MSDEPRKPPAAAPEEDLRQRREEAPEDQPGRPGAEGGSSSPDADELPDHPTDSDSALGDTDQHSSA
ncbi:MAG TPA: hypothetical protein VG405_02155 [Solirubrobacteraceae bacterium]|jgi:hypothetical protein|nr:hypothetical protein [Solirubrobacteraceae bacterium]